MLALIVIREESIRQGYSLGPILMLSYKNHALDEFLCDLLESSVPRLPGRALIRCGKAENAKLIQYGETKSNEEKIAEEKLRHCVGVIRRAQQVTRDWKSCALYFDTKIDHTLVHTNLFYLFSSFRAVTESCTPTALEIGWRAPVACASAAGDCVRVQCKFVVSKVCKP